MPKKSTDNYEAIREAKTSAPNYDLDTQNIIAAVKKWEAVCKFRVTAADDDTVDIEFDTLPKDMDAFAQELYEFCPDLVDQGTGCVHEMIEMLEESGEKPDKKMQELIKGVDFEDENYGVEILKRELVRGKKVKLWWD